MRKRSVQLLIFIVTISVGIQTNAPGGPSGRAPGLGQAQRPEFYAARVVHEKSVRDAQEALGEPDGRFAEILPGGQLVVFMEDRIYPFTNYDGGSIVGKGEAEIGLEGWFPMPDVQGKPTFGWLPLAPGISPGGFRIALVEPYSGSPGVDMIRIANSGTRSFFVDAVIGYVSPEE